MKIFEFAPHYLIRIRIERKDEQSQFITLCETTLEDVKIMVKNAIRQEGTSPFIEGAVTHVRLRESFSKNGKSCSISFRGLSTEQTKDVILTYMKNEDDFNKDYDEQGNRITKS